MMNQGRVRPGRLAHSRSAAGRAAASLGLGIAAVVLAATQVLAVGVLPDNIPQISSFSDNASTLSLPMGMAFDGTHYWSVTGNSSSGIRLAEYDAAGAPAATFSPGLDFRSVFTAASGQVYARAYNDRKIYRMTSPGVFVAGVSLTGGTLDAQSSVVLNTAGTAYIAQSGGTVDSWDLTGAFVAAKSLVGFGTLTGENSYPSGRGIAAYNGMWLTYDAGNHTLSEWDPATGVRVGQGVLTGGGTSFDSAFSFSFARGQVYVVDSAHGTWRGFALSSTSTAFTCSPATVAVGAPTTCTATVTDTSAGTQTAPTGTVQFTAPSGTFAGNPCTLAPATANSSSCQVTFTPAVVGKVTVQATYTGASAGSSGTFDVTATKRSTTTSVTCSPASVTAGGSATCTATVSDGSAGTRTSPTGLVTFSDSTAGSTFNPATCTLVAGAAGTASCSSTYTPAAAAVGSHTVLAAYAGDGTHAASTSTAAFAVTPTLPKAGRAPGSSRGMEGALAAVLLLATAAVIVPRPGTRRSG